MKLYQFKGKYSEIKPCLLCLENISKDFTVDNMTRTGLDDFSVDYYTTDLVMLYVFRNIQ